MGNVWLKRRLTALSFWELTLSV